MGVIDMILCAITYKEGCFRENGMCWLCFCFESSVCGSFCFRWCVASSIIIIIIIIHLDKPRGSVVGVGGGHGGRDVLW